MQVQPQRIWLQQPQPGQHAIHNPGVFARAPNPPASTCECAGCVRARELLAFGGRRLERSLRRSRWTPRWEKKRSRPQQLQYRLQGTRKKRHRLQRTRRARKQRRRQRKKKREEAGDVSAERAGARTPVGSQRPWEASAHRHESRQKQQEEQWQKKMRQQMSRPPPLQSWMLSHVHARPPSARCDCWRAI